MANLKLGNDATQEIRKAMTGLSGTPAKQMAKHLATQHPVTWQHIYKITKDLRPEQKTRSDKGKRTFELVEGTDLWIAAQLVVVDRFDPDQALETCKLRGHTDLPSLEYFQTILRENGLGKKQRRSNNRPFRRWEANNPGEIYQIDVTALKVRWEDEKTRRILRIEGVDKNHPNLDDSKIRVWQVMAIDDHSRRRFLRYVATTHITSRDIVEFCIELFDAWGVPLKIYTDNGAEFKRYFIRAEKILSSLLKSDGGYKHERHAPGNSQASGKVEVAHKWAEKMDRYVGLAVTEGQKVTVENLNPFADDICRFYNNRVHRTTAQTPDSRWFSKRIVVRRLPRQIIESALLTDEFDNITLERSMTFVLGKTNYEVPSRQPFNLFTDQKIKVAVPQNIDLILLTLPDGSTHEIPKIIASADVAGEYKQHAETRAENLKKRLTTSRKEAVKEIKENSRTTGEIAPVPHFNVPVEIPQTNVAHFPHQERVFTADEVAAVAPVPSSLLSEKELSYWEAVIDFGDEFSDVDEAKEFLLSIFPNEQGSLAESEIKSAIDNRFNIRQKPTRIYAVK